MPYFPSPKIQCQNHLRLMKSFSESKDPEKDFGCHLTWQDIINNNRLLPKTLKALR